MLSLQMTKNGPCPEYLGHGLMRSMVTSLYTVRCPKYYHETEGGTTFCISAIKRWNSVPINIRSSTSIKSFNKNYINYCREVMQD